MKNLLTSLKKLGKKMTGGDVTGTDLVTVVDNIAEGYSGGGGGSDNIMIVNAALTLNGQSLEDIDATYDDMAEAVLAGKFVVLRIVDNNPNAPYSSIRMLSIEYSPLDFTQANTQICFSGSIVANVDSTGAEVTFMVAIIYADSSSAPVVTTQTKTI